MSSDAVPEGCATCAHFDLDEYRCTNAARERDWELCYYMGGYCQSWRPRDGDGRQENGE